VAASADDLPSSLIYDGGADLVLAFEPGEAVRAVRKLAPHGSLVCSSRPVVPSAAATSGYDGTAQIAWLQERLGEKGFSCVDAAVLTDAGLSAKCLNVLLLGAAIGMDALPFGASELRGALAALVKPKLLAMNERALELGVGLGGR
jgi:indolepyruvate ferredoxin oxidoreductase beta subunit